MQPKRISSKTRCTGLVSSMPSCFPLPAGAQDLLVFLTKAAPKLTGSQLMSVGLNWSVLSDSKILFPNHNWHFEVYHVITTVWIILPRYITFGVTHTNRQLSLPCAMCYMMQTFHQEPTPIPPPSLTPSF